MVKDKQDSLSHEDRQDALMNSEDFKTGLGQTIHTEEIKAWTRL